MDKAFLELSMEKIDLPAPCKGFLLHSAQAIAAAGAEAALSGAVEFFYEHEFSIPLTTPLIEEIAGCSALSPYTVWLLFFLEAAQTARKDYLAQGISEEIFWETFSDLRFKALECQEIHQVWGTFVAFWYPIFYSCDIVKLGRLEFENTRFPLDMPFEAGGVCVKKGDPVKSIHIPSSGEPFHREARLISYRKAYDFFREELQGGPLVCICHSWLLYPGYRPLLPKNSNILSFQKDFSIVRETKEEKFDDGWRVFGADCEKPFAELPENTSLQKAFKRHFLSGGSAGEGIGVLIFDGEKLITA